MPSGKFAPALLDRQRIIREVHPRLEVLDRRQRRVRHSRDVDRHVAAAGEDGTADCAANIDIERGVAVEFFHAGNKLSQKVYRTSRQPQFRIYRSLVPKFSFIRDLWNVE